MSEFDRMEYKSKLVREARDACEDGLELCRIEWDDGSRTTFGCGHILKWYNNIGVVDHGEYSVFFFDVTKVSSIELIPQLDEQVEAAVADIEVATGIIGRIKGILWGAH